MSNYHRRILIDYLELRLDYYIEKTYKNRKKSIYKMIEKIENLILKNYTKLMENTYYEY